MSLGQATENVTHGGLYNKSVQVILKGARNIIVEVQSNRIESDINYFREILRMAFALRHLSF